MRRFGLFLFCVFYSASSALAQKTEIMHFIVSTGSISRVNTPVGVDLVGIVKSDTLAFRLFEDVKGKLVEKHCQVDHGYSPRLWFILDGTTPAGKSREYRLFKNSSAATVNSAIVTNVTQGEIIINKDNSEVLHYKTAMHYPPDGADTIFKRNGFIHPLFSPSGNILTRINPPDHFHHLGIWNPWTRVRIGDHVTDFWNLYEKQGTVLFSGINSVTSGPVFGGFSAKQDHIDFQSDKGSNPVINEVWEIRAWNTEPVSGKRGWLIDFTSYLSVKGNSPVIFEAYRYGGGIGIRATEEWTRENSSVLTSEGMTRKNADGTRARWTDINGSFGNNQQSGIVFFSHPSNREHPEPMRVWPEDANNNRGDVYFEFCPIRHKEWILYPGNVYRLQYRLFVYDGKTDSTAAERLWNDFAYPPEVKIKTK